MKTKLIREVQQIAETFNEGAFRYGWESACDELETRLACDSAGNANADLAVLELLATSVKNTALIIPPPNIYTPTLLILAIAALEYLNSRKPHDGGSCFLSAKDSID